MLIVCLINFQNIPPIILERIDLLSTIYLDSRRNLGLLFDRILQNPRNIRHRPRLKLDRNEGLYRSTEVKASFLGQESVNNVVKSTFHHILDVYFLRLVARECMSQESNNTRVTICLPFFSVSTVSAIKLRTHRYSSR